LNRTVIDASVVLKWYLDDEEYGQKALSLLAKYVSEELDIIAPSLLEYEVINGLLIAQKRGRIKKDKILTAIDGFVNLEIKFLDLSNLYQKVLHYCNAYKCSAYDGSYLAVAENEGAVMITSDAGLYKTVRKDLKWIKWIGDI
jgi:predicted nucleic acid-binding protein